MRPRCDHRRRAHRRRGHSRAAEGGHGPRRGVGLARGADAVATEAALAGLPGLERIVAEPDALALYVEDGAGSIAEIVRRLDRDRILVGAIAVSRPSLDDVFLDATGRRLEEDETEPERELEEAPAP